MHHAILPALTCLMAVPMLLIRRKPHGQPYIDIDGREWVSYSWPPKGTGDEGAGGGDGGGCGGDGGCG